MCVCVCRCKALRRWLVSIQKTKARRETCWPSDGGHLANQSVIQGSSMMCFFFFGSLSIIQQSQFSTQKKLGFWFLSNSDRMKKSNHQQEIEREREKKGRKWKVENRMWMIHVAPPTPRRKKKTGDCVRSLCGNRIWNKRNKKKKKREKEKSGEASYCMLTWTRSARVKECLAL